MHGIDYKTGMDLSGFSLSEKLDGLRIEYRRGRLWSKNGIPLTIPDHLAAALRLLPDLDAELYSGPGKRPCLAGLAQALRDDIHWPTNTGLFIFDSAEPLPDRLPVGLALVPSFGIADSTASALRLASTIISAGGEGIMCRAPGLPWVSGRVRGLVKVKARQLSSVMPTRPGFPAL